MYKLQICLKKAPFKNITLEYIITIKNYNLKICTGKPKSQEVMEVVILLM